jgi:hypothetical protein
MAAETSDLDDLRDGLTGRFWNLFRDHVLQEWGASGLRYQQAVEQAALKTSDGAVDMLRATLFAKKEIERLLAWPDERISQLQQVAKQAGPQGVSRRGPGL